MSYLNEQRHAYYNENSPNISDAEYDQQFDRLKYLEEKTGFILYNSPTQTVGYEPVSELPKVVHPIPLLSLDKTKLVQAILCRSIDASVCDFCLSNTLVCRKDFTAVRKNLQQ